jgi:hypothetical protein
MYVHALPPGYEFKTKKKDDEEVNPSSSIPS